jgi:hypothetical protein
MGLGSGIQDPRSGKNLFWIPDPGVKKASDPGSGTMSRSVTNWTSFFHTVLELYYRSQKERHIGC